ncbi:MAG TPA: hypothetical protein VMH22_09675 [bacterium]|nr:hypothetical protein [bacterium]
MAKPSAKIDLSAAVAEAERIVEVLRDPTLRAVAFPKVLDLVLTDGTCVSVGRTQPPAKRPTQRESTRPGPLARLKELVEDGFFDQQRSSPEILQALAERGYVLKHADLTWPLSNLARTKVLRRKKQRIGDGGRLAWFYSNW